MSSIDLEKLKKTISEGEDFLKSISHVHPMKIKRILENIYGYIRVSYQMFFRMNMILIEYLLLFMIKTGISLQQV